ncbi:MAG: hypothetical protein ACLVJ6_02235 [Merdibacter sp.]
MKGPGIKDYMNALTKCKEEAHQQGKKSIEINSKKLHQKIAKPRNDADLLSGDV